MFEITRETDSVKDKSSQSVGWIAQDEWNTYHKLSEGAPISKSSWLCQAVISKSIFGADDVADNGGRPSLLFIKEILVDWFEVQQG